MSNESSEIKSELRGDEELLWSGRPRQGWVLRGGDVLVIPFSLFWCGFVVFWEYSVIKSDAPPFFVLWGIPFVLVGLYFMFGRFFADAKLRARTYYALTPDRILIVSGLFTRKVTSLSLASLTEITLSEGKRGEGTILFGPQHLMAFMAAGMAGWPGTGQLQSPQFQLIPSVRRVYEQIREAKSSRR